MQRIYTLLFVTSVFLCLGVGCSNLFTRYKCKSDAVAHPRSADDYMNIALDHEKRNEYQCAYGACDEAIRLEPKNANAYVCRARNTRNDPAALRDCARAIELDPKTTEAYVLRSLIYEQSEKTDAAVKELETLVKLCPGLCNQAFEANIHQRLGDLYMKRKDPETAVLDYTEAVRLAPEDAESYSARAKAYRQLDRHEIADADAVKAVELEGAQFGAKTPDRIELGILNYRAISLPQPSYPTFPPDLHEAGDIEIAVEVNEMGQVTKAWQQSSGLWFRQTALPAAERVRFKPLLVNGQPAKFTGRLRYTFKAPK